MTKTQHIPVLLADVLQYLNPRPGGTYLDGTLGGAGHTEAILAASAPTGRLVGLDRDPAAIGVATDRLKVFGARARIDHASFEDAATVASRFGISAFDGILLDLGLSSDQLADRTRGFAFQASGPLDLRFDPRRDIATAELLDRWTAIELTTILGRYGELRAPRRLAERLLAAHRAQPIRTTEELVTASGLVQPRRRAQLLQALRIATNDELGVIERSLPILLRLLAPAGRLVVISFHSLEDRIVKQQLRRWQATGEGHILTKRPVTATPAEIAANLRSRSAKLRAIVRSE